MNLGSLNADRMAPLQSGAFAPYFVRVADMPLQSSYPIISWALQSVALHSSADTDFLQKAFDALIGAAELSSTICSIKAFSDAVIVKNSENLTGLTSQMVSSSGDRVEVEMFWKQWINRHVKGYVKIADPYFGLDELEILKLIMEQRPECRIEVMTSRIYQRRSNVNEPYSESYKVHWRLHIADAPPPETEITIIGTEKDHESPIHDRWWITEGAALRLGTSVNAVGLSKVSEMSHMTNDQAAAVEQRVDAFIYRQMRTYKGEKLIVETFRL